MEIVKKDGRCLKCLRIAKHKARDCKEQRNCSKCDGLHHAAVCRRLERQKADNLLSIPEGMALPAIAREDRSMAERLLRGVFTMTATVEIATERGWRRAMCYVDEGATVSMIQQRAAEEANVEKIDEVDMAIQAVGYLHPARPHNVRRVRFRGTYAGEPTIEIFAVEEQQIAKLSALQHTNFAKELHEKGYSLADDRFLNGNNSPCEVELLIGANAIWDVVGRAQIEHSSGLRAVDSKIG